MKKMRSLLAVLIALLGITMAGTQVSAQDRELFLNTALTNGTEGWSARNINDTAMSVETADTYGGYNSLKVGITGWGFVYQLVELEPGGEYVISYNAKNLADATENFSVHMSEVDGLLEINAAAVGTKIYTDTVSPVWREYSFKYRYDGTEKITAKILFIGPANYLISNARMLQTNYEPKEQKNTLPFQNSVYVDFDNGNDANQGTQDSPFKTLERARDFVRCINKEMPEDITVYISGKEYEIDHTLEFTAEDSAPAGRKIIYKGVGEEKPIIRGSGRVTGWRLHDEQKNIWVADLDTDAGRQLFVNGVRADLASYTKPDFACETVFQDCFYVDEDMLLTLAHPTDMEVVTNEEWTQKRRRVTGVVREGDRIRIDIDSRAWSQNKYMPTTIYRLDNQYEFLDEPGEYYRDSRENKLYYIPRVGEDMETAEAVFPAVEKLVSVFGDNPFSYVNGITFDGLKFEYSTAQIPECGIDDNQNLQLRWDDGTTHSLPGALDIRYGHDIDILNCDVEHHGGMGIRYTIGIQDCDIVGNRMYDLSAHGVMIGDPGEPYEYLDATFANCGTPAYRDMNNSIVNNYIADIACEYNGATGISILFSQYTRIAHNDLFDLPYTGIHIAWGWDQYVHSLKGLVVENNYLNYVMTVLRDGGGIYSLGRSSATLEEPNLWRENYISMMTTSGAPYYLDQGSSYHRLVDNVIEHKDTMWVAGKGWQRPFGGVSGNALSPEYNNTYARTYFDVQSMQKFMDFTGTFEKNVYNMNGQWDPVAVEIMGKAGLEEAYQGIRDEIRRMEVPSTIELMAGETASCKPAKITGAKEQEQDPDQYAYQYMSSDETVATVDDAGNIRAVSNGHAVIYVRVDEKRNTEFYTIDVVVGSTPARIGLTADTSTLLVSETTGLYPTVYTNYDTEKAFDGVISYTSLTPDIVSVDENGVVTSLRDGQGIIQASAVVDGVTVTGEITIENVNYSLSNPTPFSMYPLQAELADVDNWSTKGTKTAAGIDFNALGDFSIYRGRKFGDEILAFNYTIGTGPSTWPAVMFRLQNDSLRADSAGQNGYIICFTNTGDIELQRFNSGTRTQIFCEVNDGSLPGAGPAYTNDLFKYGQTVRMRVGAINEADGVRIILYINDVCVFDYLDKGQGAVREDGYFGIVSQGNTISLAEYTEEQIVESSAVTAEDIIQSYREAKTEYDSSKMADLDGTWYAEDVRTLLNNGINVARNEVEFGAGDYVTRGEFLNMLLDYMNYWYTTKGRLEEYKTELTAVQNAKSAEEKNLAILEGAKATGLVCDEMVQNGFDLNAPVSRQEAAYMTYQTYLQVMLANPYVYDELYDVYTDKDQISAYAQEAVAALYGMDLIKGVENNTFAPNNAIERVWAAQILKRLWDTIYFVW